MKFHFLTIFPEMIRSYIDESILKRAQEKKLISFDVKNIRDYSKDRHQKVDDRPYGGGPGMVMNAEPILRAVRSLKFEVTRTSTKNTKTRSREMKIATDTVQSSTLHSMHQKTARKIKVILLSPNGKLFTNIIAKKMAKQYSDIIFICGRYEGVDDRVRKILKAEEYSVGNYVLTGGELPALTMTDAIARQIPGVLGDFDSVEENRTASPRVYTRPEVLVWKDKKHKVPKVLLGGNHKAIESWRAKQQ